MSKDTEKKGLEKKAINTKKWLYYFEVPRKRLQKVKEEKTDEEGKKFTIEKEEEVEETVEIYLKRPTRRVYDECNLFYSVKISEGIKQGLMTRAMLSKRYRDDQGALSDEEKEALNEKYNILLIKEKEFQVIQLNLAEGEMSLEERQERLAELVEEIEELKGDLESFEFAAESLYEHTAEARAGRLTNMWWLLHLTHFKVDEAGAEKYQPFCVGKNFEKKMEAYSVLEERIAQVEDRFVDFETSVIEKATYLLSAWNGGNVTTFEDFQKVEESLISIQEEVKKDDTLQVIYEQKVKELASLEDIIEGKKETLKNKSPEKAEEKKPEEPISKPEEPVSKPEEPVSE